MVHLELMGPLLVILILESNWLENLMLQETLILQMEELNSKRWIVVSILFLILNYGVYFGGNWILS